MSESNRLPTEKDHGDDKEFGVTRWLWADIESSIADVLRGKCSDAPTGDEGEEERMTVAIALAGEYGALIAEKADRTIAEAQCAAGFEVLEAVVREVIPGGELTMEKGGLA